MERTPVRSSAFRAVGYDVTQQCLEIEYHPKDGVAPVWRYEPVTAEQHAQLMAGESLGRELALIRRQPDIVAYRGEDVVMEADAV